MSHNKDIDHLVPFKLEDSQLPAFDRHTKIIKSFFGAINTAPPGAGKSFTTMSISYAYDYLSFIICPANAISTWEDYVKQFNIKAIILSYNMLIGKGKSIKHNYLRRTFDNKYEATDEFKRLVNGKMLLVFDESQRAKNPKSVTCQACHTLSNVIVKTNNGSRILALSATPIDVKPFVESIIKLLGIITVDKLFIYELGKKNYIMDGYGYEQLYNFCYKINPKLASEFRPTSISATLIKESMYLLYTNIVVPTIGFTMTRPIIKSKFVGINKFFKMSKDSKETISNLLSIIKKEVNYDNGNVSYDINGIAKIIEGMKNIELEKVPLFIRLITDVLTYVPNSKVIMYVWYDITVDILMSELKQYNPLRCDGKVSQKIKTDNRRFFQEPNLNYRLIIAKPTSFGDCVSLHDNNSLGLKFPRFNFINPSFHFNSIVQAAGRTYRVGTVSDATVTITYCQDTEESNVINALSKKGTITRACTAKLLDADIYNEDVEEDDDDEYETNDKFSFVDEWQQVTE